MLTIAHTVFCPSPSRRVRNSIDHASTPPISAVPPSTTPSIPLKAERPTTPNRRASLSKTPVSASKMKGTKGNNAGIAIGSVDKILSHEVNGFENAIGSPMSMEGDSSTIMQADLLTLSDPPGSLMASQEVSGVWVGRCGCVEVGRGGSSS